LFLFSHQSLRLSYQEKIESAKSLVERGMVELKTFQADFVTNKSTCLDQLGEEFMRTLEKRKAQLVDIVQLFDDIEKVCYVATFVCI